MVPKFGILAKGKVYELDCLVRQIKRWNIHQIPDLSDLIIFYIIYVN